jgi:hypothetical protein
MPIVDFKIIEIAKTKNGGYTKKQLEIIGVDWPPKKGWKREFKNKKIFISENEFYEFLEIGKNS